MNNNVTHIPNEEGEKVETHEDIESEILNYFKQAHQEPQIGKSQAIEKITRNIPKVITEEHNQLLLRPVDLQEVETIVRQLKEGKAPSLDGFTSKLFHNFWELIKLEVWQVVEESRTLRWMIPTMNSTFIALIPKEDQPNTTEKYRPIAPVQHNLQDFLQNHRFQTQIIAPTSHLVRAIRICGRQVDYGWHHPYS